MRKFAFTIIELLVVIAIIGMLIAAASLAFVAAQRTGRDAQRMSDVLTIGKAVDLTASASNGIYPGKQPVVGIPVGNFQQRTSDMCADQINSYNPISPLLTTSVFKNGIIPIDPAHGTIVNSSWNCGFPDWGYIYQTHYLYSQLMTNPNCTYPSPYNDQYTCSMAVQLNVDYLIEVGLENPLPVGSTLFKQFTASDLSGTYSTERSGGTNKLPDRNVYYLPGPYCGTTCYH